MRNYSNNKKQAMLKSQVNESREDSNIFMDYWQTFSVSGFCFFVFLIALLSLVSNLN